MSFAAGSRRSTAFPTDALPAGRRRDPDARRRHGVEHGPTEGQPRFRAAIAERFGGLPENILVLAGAQQGLDLLARCLVDPGDAVIVDRPGYLGAISSFRCAGARLIGWDIRRADLDELEELAAAVPAEADVSESDASESDRHHAADSHAARADRARRALPRADRRGRHLSRVERSARRRRRRCYALDERNTVVIHLNSFAKMLAPGLRLGWISAVPPIVEQLALIKQQVDPHTQNLSQLAVADLMENGVFDRHVVRRSGASTGAAATRW